MAYDILTEALKVTDPAFLLQGLLRDAGEAYLAGMPKPIKHLLAGFQGIGNGMVDVVMSKFMVPTQSAEFADVIHAACKGWYL